MDPITLRPNAPLTPPQIVDIARTGARVDLDPAARRVITACRAALDRSLDDGRPHYGINTGFGSLANQRIDRADLATLQRNLIRSHAAGVGEPLPVPVVRAMMAVLAASLARGRSGVRPELVEHLIAVLNAGITPVVPESGSVGASGDLAPLAHVSQVLIGEGEAFVGGRRMSGSDALRGAGLEPIELAAKEGLALINGTHLMAGRMALITEDLHRVLKAALHATALSIDGSRASHGFLDPRIYAARNQPGPTRVAAALRGLLDGGTIADSHKENDPRVQDPYSYRCAPLVLGAAWDTIEYAEARLRDELGAVTDNPLIFDESGRTDIVSAGCFHGMPVALPLDTLAVAVAHIAGIAERRTYHMLSVFDPQSELRAFLSPKPGLQSGFMIVQYSAAAMCNEIIGLANPASVANLSTCAGMEDYNSFGPRSAAKATRAVDLCRSVVAIELLCAAEAVEAHRPHRTGDILERTIATIRDRVPALTEDRSPTPDIAAIDDLIRSGHFTAPDWDS
ncbi:MAG: histidine ammonia-lyase [Phycisphaerales bacterium]|nr:histidine ammonia-lyase [Planctomycetota bacterium]MCH8509546.1 histidine ammonia-lyase [Phycisphaerales bacterium]